MSHKIELITFLSSFSQPFKVGFPPTKFATTSPVQNVFDTSRNIQNYMPPSNCNSFQKDEELAYLCKWGRFDTPQPTSLFSIFRGIWEELLHIWEY